MSTRRKQPALLPADLVQGQDDEIVDFDDFDDDFDEDFEHDLDEDFDEEIERQFDDDWKPRAAK